MSERDQEIIESYSDRTNEQRSWDALFCPSCNRLVSGGPLYHRVNCPPPEAREVERITVYEQPEALREWLRLILKADSASDRERSLVTLANMARSALHPKEKP